MAQVGIREFKAGLSRYLREVRRGRPVYLTDRGEVVAQITAPVGLPGSGAQTHGSTADARLRALVERGVVRPAAQTDRLWASGPLVRMKPGTARRLLDADRDG